MKSISCGLTGFLVNIWKIQVLITEKPVKISAIQFIFSNAVYKYGDNFRVWAIRLCIICMYIFITEFGVTSYRFQRYRSYFNFANTGYRFGEYRLSILDILIIFSGILVIEFEVWVNVQCTFSIVGQVWGRNWRYYI